MRISLKLFIGTFIANLSFWGTLLGLISYFKISPFAKLGYWGILIVIETSLVLTFLIIILKSILPEEESLVPIYERKKIKSNKIAKNLKDELAKYMDQCEYNNVIRFGSSISRVLYLNAEYESRVEIGKMVDEAATRMNDDIIKAKTLIDDIGWTLVYMNKHEEAKTYINLGIKLAEKNKNYFIASKGYRHLSGIEIQQKHASNSIELLEKSLEVAKKINNEKKKKEIIAGIYYGFGEAYYLNADYKKAQEYSEKAKSLFIELKDNDRYAKYFAQIGKIELANGNLEIAKDYFIKGEEYSGKIKRLDELLRNYLGISFYFLKKGQKKEYKKLMKKIKSLLNDIPIVFWDDILSQIKQLESGGRL